MRWPEPVDEAEVTDAILQVRGVIALHDSVPKRRGDRALPWADALSRRSHPTNWWLIGQSDLLYLCLDVLVDTTKAARVLCSVYGVRRLRSGLEIPAR